MAHKKTQELSRRYSKHTLGVVKLALVLTKIVKSLLQVCDQSRGILGLDDDIIHVGFYIMTDLFS